MFAALTGGVVFALQGFEQASICVTAAIGMLGLPPVQGGHRDHVRVRAGRLGNPAAHRRRPAAPLPDHGPPDHLGLFLFAVGTRIARTSSLDYLKHTVWLVPWMGGTMVIGARGQFGNGAAGVLPARWDIVVVTLFYLAIFRWAVSLGLPSAKVAADLLREATKRPAGPLDAR